MSPGKQKVLMVTEFFLPHWTGLAKAFLFHAKRLVEQGHDVTVLTTKFDDKLPAEEEISGFLVKRSPCLFRISRTNYSLQLIVDCFKMAKDFDQVIVNSPFSNIFFVTLIAKLFGKKVAIFHQGDLILSKHGGSKISNFLIERVFDVFTLGAMALADCVSTYTRDYAENSRVMKYFMHKFKAVIPKLSVSKDPPNPQFKERMDKLVEAYTVVGFAGRFVEEKGFDIMLRAMPIVKRAIPDVKFVFAGEVNVVYENFFQANYHLIQENQDVLEILGLLKDNDLFYFYNNLKIFALSSRSDCFPLTQIECSMCGIPIVVTDIPGARMLVKETGFGRIAPPNDPDALAAAIVDAITNRDQIVNKLPNVINFFKNYESLWFE